MLNQCLNQYIYIKKVFIKHFLTFVDRIKSSNKIALKNVFNVVKYDCQSVTGSNLRNIMLLVDKTNIDSLCVSDSLNIPYHEIPQEELWRVELINETVDTLWGENTVEGFTRDEISSILGYACAS